MFRVEDIVKVVDPSAYFYGTIGVIRYILDKDNSDDEYYFFVQFEMIDDDTGEVSVYEDCYYTEQQIKLFEGEC